MNTNLVFETPDFLKDSIKAEVILVVVGESGYYPQPDHVRIIDPLPEEVILAAVSGSMFGWDVPAAQPALDYVTQRHFSVTEGA